MKYKDPVTGELKSITVKSGDTLPLGTIVEFDGTEIPDGYEEVSYEETGSMGNIIVDDIKCKNLADIDDFNVNGLDTAFKVIYVKPNTEYTLSFNKSRISGVSIQNPSIYEYGALIFFENNTQLSLISGKLFTLGTNGSIDLKTTFTTPEKCNKVGIRFFNNNGDANINTKVSKVQLEPGSIATDYIKHKKMSYNDVDSMGDIVVDNISCKNLFNSYNFFRNKALNDSDGTVFDASNRATTNFIKVKPNSNYIFSNITRTAVCLYDNNHTFIKTITADLITTTTNTSYIRFTFKTDEDYSRGQLEAGSVATEYTEYRDYSNSLGSILKCVYNKTTWNDDLINTGINVNGGDGGKTYLVCWSTHSSTGDRTTSYIGMLRCGYNGNNYKLTEIVRDVGSSSALLVTFSVDENGYLQHKNSGASGASRIFIYQLT